MKNPRQWFLLALVIAAPSATAERLLLAGGESADEAYYSYLGMVVTGPARENGRGFLQRYWLDYFGYEYDGGPGRVTARAHGAEAAVGYGGSSRSGWANASVGIRFTDTNLSPDDPAADARGSQLGVKLQLQGEREFAADWSLGAIASVSSRQNEYWGRLRLTHDTTSVMLLGAEVVAGGNRESEFSAAGLVLVLRPASAPTWSVAFKAGARRQDGDDGAYAGTELGYAF
jgi:hypothetical protein